MKKAERKHADDLRPEYKRSDCVARMAHSGVQAKCLLTDAMADSGEYAAFARELGKTRGST